MILVEYKYAAHPPKTFRKVFFSTEKDAINTYLSTLEDVPNVNIRELKEEII